MSFVQIISSKLPYILLPNLVLRYIIMSWSVMQKDWSAIFKVKVTAMAQMIKMWLSTISSDLLILLLPDFVWLYITISQSILWRNCIAVFKMEVAAKFQNVSEYLSSQYLVNCWTFYYQTWYGDASSWARLSSHTHKKKNGLLSSRSRSQWSIIQSKHDCLISSELLILLQPNLVWWYIIISWIAL